MKISMVRHVAAVNAPLSVDWVDWTYDSVRYSEALRLSGLAHAFLSEDGVTVDVMSDHLVAWTFAGQNANRVLAHAFVEALAMWRADGSFARCDRGRRSRKTTAWSATSSLQDCCRWRERARRW